MSDYKKPRTNLNNFLPEQLRSAFLKNLNENLFNRYLTKDEFTHTVGIIGDANPDSASKQIKEQTAYRQEEQLQPVISSTVGTETQYLSFEDFLQRLSRLDVNIDDFAEWGKSMQFNLVPPIDIDKLVNYRNYYWSSSDNTEIPDYITIKNQKNWAQARSFEFKKLITSVQQSYPVVTTGDDSAYLTGNQLSSFSQGDQILLSNGADYYTTTINSITLNPTSGRTIVTFTNQIDQTVTSMYSLLVKIVGIDVVKNQFVLNGDWSGLFIKDYIFVAPQQLNNENTLFSVVESTYVDNTVDKTYVTVDQKIPLTSSWTQISLYPLISLTEEEYNSIAGDNKIQYNAPWNNRFLGDIIWDRELQVLDSNAGYSVLGDHGIRDDSKNFVASLIRPGDYLVINSGPVIGKYLIISVQDHFLGIDSSVRMFSKNNISYVIERETIYDYILSNTAPSSPVLYDYWSDTTSDTLRQWNGGSWVQVVKNISLLVNATHQRYKLSLQQTDAWSTANKWVHKNQITSYSGKTRAQLPIIEFDPFLELSFTSKASYDWKYRKGTSDLYSTTTDQPNLFEISNIKIVEGGEFLFSNDNTLVLSDKYGNLTDTIKAGSTIKLSGFVSNNGVYEVVSSSYKQRNATSRFATSVVLKNKVTNPFDLPVNATVGPEKTSMGDTWLGYDAHWMFFGMKDINASSVGPEINPALNVFVKSITDDVNHFESNVGLAWQTYSYSTDNNVGPRIPLDTSLHDMVLYDDYQEGDIRVYVNGTRQYGNFQDIPSDIDSNFIGSIKFDSSVIINKEDVIRIELGEYILADVGRRAVKVKSNKNLVDPNLSYDLVNLTTVRKLEQDKQIKNEYPYFTIYDINGEAKDIASRIFTYEEDSSYALNQYILKRIVYDASTSDYGFVQELSDKTTGELYSYKNFSQPNYPLQTIWKRGLNNEQYQPAKLADGSWEIPNTWFYNINHELRSELKYSDLYQHFATVINEQEVPGVIKSNSINQFYVDDNVNFGLGGTIKEHNTGLDILVSSMFVNNVNPLVLIQFGHDRYTGALNYIQDEFLETAGKILLNKTFNNLKSLQSNISEYLISSYESNNKFDSWFGDSTTYNGTTGNGIKNWIATLPYLNLAKKHTPYIVSDNNIGMYDVVCHDGHREHINIQPSVVQKLNNYLVTNGAIKQVVTSDTQAFPVTNVTGALLVRINTAASTTRTYRFSSTGVWEEFNYAVMLSKVMLQIEQGLYDNCPDVDLIYDFSELTTNERYEALLNTQFSNFAKNSNITTPLLNTAYKSNDPFTWNYEFTPIQQHPLTGTVYYGTASNYRSLYKRLYGTPYPHREPWFLQGYTDKPSWWDSLYVDTTGSRVWNELMWSNVTNGVVPLGKTLPNGNVSNGTPSQVRMYRYVPVNMNAMPTNDGYVSDALLPPYWNSANTPNSKIRTPYDAKLGEEVVSPNLDYTFGDGNINEWNWSVSSQRLYDNLILAFKIDPLNFTNISFNGNKLVKINCLDVDSTTRKVFSHKDTIFHGDIINNTVFKSNGLNQWYINYNRYHGYDGDASQFQPFWKTWDSNLSYLFSSYVDKASFAISNTTFDITSKDYNIGVKKTVGFSDVWMDSLRATVLSVPSKYSTLRDNGIGWTVQFDSSSPVNRNINYYAKENFDFRTVKNNNVFEVYAYDMEGAGIVYPITSRTISYSESLADTASVEYKNNRQYSAKITIGDETTTITIKGSKVSTISDVLEEINLALGASGVAYLSSGNIVIQSNGDNVNIDDNGLFVSLSSYYAGILSQVTTAFEFDKSFDINGNLTNQFIEGQTFTITDSTQFNGTYTIKSVYYDISNTITKIFVNESISVTSDVIDGIIRPSNRRSLPESWTDGTQVYLSTMGTLPSPFNEYRMYYVTRLSDFTFQLSAIADGQAIMPLTNSTTQQFVGRVKQTFKASNGDVTSYTWRQHYSDKREVMSYAQPVYISGIQQMIDFVDGYSDYLEDQGFQSKTSDILNTENGLQVSWQSEVESFIDDLYITRSINQNDSVSFGVKVDLDNSRFIYTDANVSLASNQIGVSPRVVFTATAGKLPSPIDNPLKTHIPYYVMPSNDGLGFQIAYTQADASKGNYIKLEDVGAGDLEFSLYNSGAVYPQYWLNPYKNAMKIAHPQGILSNVLENDRMDILTNQKIYDINGNGINAKNVYVLREDEVSQIFLTDEVKRANATAKNPTVIAGIHAFIDSYEHILVLNDRTITDDLVYDSFLGIRTPRFYVEFDRQENFTLRPNVGGFFVYNDDLVQNFESAVNDLRYMNDVHTALESKPIVQELRKSMGYTGQQSFLKNLGINSKTDFLFWLAMIRNKGTNLAIKAYTNQNVFKDADLDEFWAYKLAEFGDAKEQNYIEMKLTRADSIKREARFEFVNPEENASDDSFTAIAVSDKTRWWDQPDVVSKLSPNQSFFLNASVSSISYNQQSVIKFINGNYILVLAKRSDGVVLTYVDPTSQKVRVLIEGLDYNLINKQTVQFVSDYDPRTLTGLTVSTITYNYRAHNPSVFVDKKAGVILDQVGIWNPAEGQHFSEAYALADYKLAHDPAVYNVDFTTNTYNNVWATNNLDKVWLDTSKLYYLPYDDSGIYPDINDRIDQWGKLAENGELKVYQWTHSTVAPIDYEDTYPNNGTPRQLLYKNSGTKNNPVWNLLTVSRESFLVSTIVSSTTTTLTGIVKVYRNGKFDMNLNLAVNSLYAYAYGTLIPGQSIKPKLNDSIVIETILPVPTRDDLDNLVYKLDTPYTTMTSVNATNGGTVTHYYFWVNGRSDKIESVTNYVSTAYQMEKDLVNNPSVYMIPLDLRYKDDGYGVNFGNVFDGTPYNLPVRYVQLAVKGLKGLVSEEDRFALRFIRDFTLRDRMPINGDIFDYSDFNAVKSSLSLKNKHTEWKLFREKQSQKIDQYLWDKLISALVGYNVSNNIINESTTIPSLDRVLFDELYDAGSRYGLGDDQIFVDPTIGLATIKSILTDSTQSFKNIDIVSFLDTYKFASVNGIVDAMYAIYESFDASNVNNMYFSVLSDAMALKKESPDFFKTSWVALDIAQNVITTEQTYSSTTGNIIPGGACDIDENIVVPTPPPLPSPSPTPSVSPSVTPTASRTITPSATATVSVTSSLTPTPTVTGTPGSTATPTVTFTPTASQTPEVTATPTFTPTASVTASITPTASVTATPTMTPTISPVGNSCYDTIVLTADPLVYFKLDDLNTGVARDYTNHGFDGFYQGDIVQGNSGLFNTSVRSIEFLNDFSQNNFIYNNYDESLNMPYDFTFEIHTDANLADQHAALPSLVYLAYNAASLQPQFQLFIDVDTGKYAFQISTSDSPQLTVYSSTIADGTPHVITCRRMNDKIFIFIDGREEGSLPVTGTNNMTTVNGIMLGGSPYQIPSLYNYVGGMDCFSLYNYALPDRDISSRYECIAGISITPSPTPTPSATPSVTGTPTVTPTVTASVTASVTPSVTASVTPSSTPPVTPTRTASSTPSATPAPSNTPAASNTPQPTPTPTASQTSAQSACPDCTNNGNMCCVAVESNLPDGKEAGDIKVNDTMMLADNETMQPATGVVSYSKTETMPCVRIETESGASLVCSTSAPIPSKDNGYVYAPDTMGEYVATMIDGISKWDKVISVTDVGDKLVQHITVGDKCFWAGEKTNAFILHHNAKSCAGVCPNGEDGTFVNPNCCSCA